MEPRRELFNSIGLLILRLGIGGFMLPHGWGKVQMLLNGNSAQFGDPIGLGPQLSLTLAAAAEFGGALLLIFGLLTRFAAFGIVFTMAVAAFVAHGADPWTMGEGAKLFMTGQAKSWASKEPAMLFLIPSLALVFTGAGKFSIDAMIWRRRSP
jgi:putative oxidoreductase